MAQALVAAAFPLSLDVLRHLTTQVAFDLDLRIDERAQLGAVAHARAVGALRVGADDHVLDAVEPLVDRHLQRAQCRWLSVGEARNAMG